MAKTDPKTTLLCMRIGATIKQLIETRGLNANQILKNTGITPATLQRYIEGRNLSVIKLAEICYAIDIPLCVITSEPGTTIITNGITYTT